MISLFEKFNLKLKCWEQSKKGQEVDFCPYCGKIQDKLKNWNYQICLFCGEYVFDNRTEEEKSRIHWNEDTKIKRVGNGFKEIKVKKEKK